MRGGNDRVAYLYEVYQPSSRIPSSPIGEGNKEDYGWHVRQAAADPLIQSCFPSVWTSSPFLHHLSCAPTKTIAAWTKAEGQTELTARVMELDTAAEVRLCLSVKLAKF